MRQTTKLDKIADAIRTVGRAHGMANAGDAATIRVADVAAEAKIEPTETLRILREEANLVWGKLPFGWTFALAVEEADGTPVDAVLHLARRRSR